jgi:hypothetical protein
MLRSECLATDRCRFRAADCWRLADCTWLLLLLPPLLHAISQIKMLADNPDQWALLLGAAFPNSSNFFLVRCIHGYS